MLTNSVPVYREPCYSNQTEFNSRRTESDHYGVPRSTPVFSGANPNQLAGAKPAPSEYSVPKPIMPNFALEKLDMGE